MDKLLFIMIVIFLLIVNIHLQTKSSIFTSSNKTIWMYWEQGEEKINNSYIKMCINGWKRLNPNWNIRVLNYNTALQYIPELKNYNHLIVQMRSDVLRLKLLEKLTMVLGELKTSFKLLILKYFIFFIVLFIKSLTIKSIESLII